MHGAEHNFLFVLNMLVLEKLRLAENVVCLDNGKLSSSFSEALFNFLSQKLSIIHKKDKGASLRVVSEWSDAKAIFP